MTKEELIKHWEEELTFTQELVKSNINNNELSTALRHQLHEKSILMFLKSLKQLSEEPRKDFEKVFCEHCGLPIRLLGNGTVTQLCECRLHE